jgi:asparagine synthetase B (glutamine-hydrolysing)
MAVIPIPGRSFNKAGFSLAKSQMRAHGPDSKGPRHQAEASVGHHRLSIFDLNYRAAQPMQEAVVPLFAKYGEVMLLRSPGMFVFVILAELRRNREGDNPSIATWLVTS